MNDDKNNKEEIDLSNMFKDSDVGEKPQSQEEWQKPAQTFYPGTPKLIQWVIKYSGGLIKNKRQASYVLLGFAALAMIIALVLVFGGGGNKIEVPPLETPPLP